MADVRPSVISWIIVGLMAASFIVVMKWATVKYPIWPPLTQFFQSV